MTAVSDSREGDAGECKCRKSGIQANSSACVQVNDPLDNADYGIVDGMDASPKVDEFSRELRAHTGCDVGEKDCVDKFLLTKGAPAPSSAKK